MRFVVISVGKKHDATIAAAINEFSTRVSRSAELTWEFIMPSGKQGSLARHDETIKILARLKLDDTVWLLDELGQQITSPDLALKLESAQNNNVARIIIIVGGAFGVDEALRARANFVWSLSKLVFPHQIVRLLLVEQLYRAYEINHGSGYHHS